MNKQKILIIFVTAIILLVMSIFFVLQKKAPLINQNNKCGDGICDDKEKNNPELCPIENCDQDKNVIIGQNKTVGFLGCSITHNAIDGYEKVGGTDFWRWNQSEDNNFGGGCVSTWFNQLNNKIPEGQKDYWAIFQKLIDENPETNKIWWEICSCDEVSKMNYSNFLSVLNRIKEIAPNKQIYVSPMPNFVDSPQEKTCTSNLNKINNTVDLMIKENKILTGPFLSFLSDSNTTNDGCHATEEGKEIWGQELKKFFDQKNNDNTPYYVIIQHYDPVGPISDMSVMNSDNTWFYKEIKERVSLAEENNIKLTLWLGHGLAEYMMHTSERIAVMKNWIKFGHEIGMHHHSIYKTEVGGWDGYSSYDENEAVATRFRLAGGLEKFGYLGNFDEYIKIFNDIENELGIVIKSGIGTTQHNKIESMPDELLYGAGSGFANNGEPGRWIPDDGEISKANNEYISKAIVNGIERKWITHFTFAQDNNHELDAEKKFNNMDSSSVFAGVTHNYSQETNNYKKFIQFLGSKDPFGLKSKTVSEIMENKILPEVEIDLPCERAGGELCSFFEKIAPQTCMGGDWIIYDNTSTNYVYRCCATKCEKL